MPGFESRHPDLVASARFNRPIAEAVAARLPTKAKQRVRDDHQQKGHAGNNPRLQSGLLITRRSGKTSLPHFSLSPT